MYVCLYEAVSKVLSKTCSRHSLFLFQYPHWNTVSHWVSPRSNTCYPVWLVGQAVLVSVLQYLHVYLTSVMIAYTVHCLSRTVPKLVTLVSVVYQCSVIVVFCGRYCVAMLFLCARVVYLSCWCSGRCVFVHECCLWCFPEHVHVLCVYKSGGDGEGGGGGGGGHPVRKLEHK